MFSNLFTRSDKNAGKPGGQTGGVSTVVAADNEQPPSSRSDDQMDSSAAQEAGSHDFQVVESRESDRQSSQATDNNVQPEGVDIASMRQELETMQRAMIDKKRELADMEMTKQAWQDRANGIALERDGMHKAFEAAQSAMIDKERELTDMERMNQAWRDRANELALERDGLVARSKVKDSQNGRLQQLKHDAEESAGRARAQISVLEDNVRRQQQEAKTSHAEMTSVKACMDSAQKLLENRTEELKGAQPFMTQADSFSGAEVIALVQSLNGEIFELSAFMADSFPMAGGMPFIGEEQRVAQRNVEGYLGFPLKGAIVSLAHNEDPTVLQMALQCYLAWSSMRIIRSWTFQKDFPNIATLYEWVRREESQALAGRWRALTRQHLHQMTTVGRDSASGIQGYICNNLADILLSAKCQLTRPQITDELSKYGDRIGIVINAAIHLKHVLGECVTSSDLDVVNFKGGAKFDPTMMEDGGGQGSSRGEVVLCTTELGLRREAKVVKNGQETMEVTLLLKPKVALEIDVVQLDSSSVHRSTGR